MLRELSHITPDRGLRRRWFQDDYFDLIVWIDSRPEIVRFQLCYDKLRDERSLTWHRQEGFTHESVDEGTSSVWDMNAPVLQSGGDGALSPKQLCAFFAERSVDIDQAIAQFIGRRLEEYADKAGTPNTAG